MQPGGGLIGLSRLLATVASSLSKFKAGYKKEPGLA